MQEQDKKHFNRILLVDDDKASLYLHQKLLEKLQIAERIEEVSNGLEALEYLSKLCQQAESGQDYFPELLLLDISMPVVNGFEFLQVCEKMGIMEGKNVKVILVTSSENEWDKQQAQQYRVDGYLIKPLTEEKLLPLL